MPALNFQKQFADNVLGSLTKPEASKGTCLPLWINLAMLGLPEDLMKRQTIRASRKDGRDIVPGDTIYLYTGMRTANCLKLGEVKCTVSQKIIISDCSVSWVMPEGWINDESSQIGLDMLAISDGFMDWKEMRAWFAETYGLPFKGNLIKW